MALRVLAALLGTLASELLKLLSYYGCLVSLLGGKFL